MLVCYAREMKESFAPYCQQVLDIMVPLLDFYFNDEVSYNQFYLINQLIDFFLKTCSVNYLTF